METLKINDYFSNIFNGMHEFSSNEYDQELVGIECARVNTQLIDASDTF